MKGLSKKNNFSKNRVHELDTVLNFGQCQGCTVQDVIDDSQCNLMQYYVNNGIIEMSNEAYTYLRKNCLNHESCSACKEMNRL